MFPSELSPVRHPHSPLSSPVSVSRRRHPHSPVNDDRNLSTFTQSPIFDDQHVSIRQPRTHMNDSISFTQSPIFDDQYVSIRRPRRNMSTSISMDDSFVQSPVIDDRNVSFRRPRTPMNDSISFEQSPIFDDANVSIRRPRRNMSTSMSMDDSFSSLRSPRRRRGRRPSTSDLDLDNAIINSPDVSLERSESREEDEEEMMDEEEYRRQLAIIHANAKFYIDEFDTPDKYVELPIQITSLHIEDDSVYDVMNLENTTLKKFLEEDKDNIAFKFGTQKEWMGATREFLAHSIKNPSQISYECIEANQHIGDANLVQSPLYFQLRGIGFPSGVVSIHQIGAILRDNGRMYLFEPSNKILKSTFSFGYKRFYLPSSNGCNPGNEAVVYNVFVIGHTEMGGNSTSKKRTSKKRTTKRKTARNNKKSKKSKKSKRMRMHPTV